MSKKKNQIILVVCGLIMAGVIIYNLIASGGSFLPKENVWNKQEVSAGDSSNNDSGGNSTVKATDDKDLEGKLISEGEEAPKEQGTALGEEFQVNDLIFKINSVEKTKDKRVYAMPPLDKPFFTSDENGKTLSEDYLLADEKGTILNEYSYLVVNVTIKNTKEIAKEYYLNSISLQMYDDKGKDIYGPSPLLNDKEIDVEKREKDYFRYEFQPLEEREVTIVFIAEDKYLDYNNLKLRIENHGPEYSNSTSLKYVKVKY